MNDQFEASNNNENDIFEASRSNTVSTSNSSGNETNINDNFDNNSKPINPWIERLKGIGIVGGFYLSQFIASILMSILIIINVQNITTQDEYVKVGLNDMFIAMVSVETVFIIILILIYRSKITDKLKEPLSNMGVTIVKLIKYFFLLWIINIIFSTIDATFFPNLIEESGSNQDLIETALSTPSIFMIISICLTAPIVEEYVFRFGVMSKLFYGINRYVAAVLAAFLFSFAHIGFSQAADPALFIHLLLGYMGPSLVFAYVYARENNLFYSIALHILSNAQAVIIILLYF